MLPGPCSGKRCERCWPQRAGCCSPASRPGWAAIGDNQLGGWYGYRAAQGGPDQFPALPRAASGSGGFSLAVCRCSIPAHHGNAALGAFRAFGTVRAAVQPGTAAIQLLDVLRGEGPEQAGDSWLGTGRDFPGEQAGPAPRPWLLSPFTAVWRAANSSGWNCLQGRLFGAFQATRWRRRPSCNGPQPASSADAPVISGFEAREAHRPASVC